MASRNTMLTLIVGGALGFFIWLHPPPAWAAMQTAGLFLLVAGFLLWSVARFQLGNSFTVVAEARQLVTRGLYERIRNPIYVFGSWVIAGLILLLGRPIWLLIFVLLIPLQIWRARQEASVLDAKFGEEYRKYRAATWL